MQKKFTSPLLSEKTSHWVTLLIPLFVAIAAFPQFFLFKVSPFQGDVAAVQDTWAGFITIAPGSRVFRWELLHNGNFLWSSLRGMGLPIPAGEIQAAPWFPLSVILAPLPEDIYWNAFTAIRLTGIAVGSFSLARWVLNFPSLGSLLFMLSFGLGIYHLRWINHPFQNGLLATVWYLFFAGRCLVKSSPQLAGNVGLYLGVIFSLYSTATCGFPESMVVGAVLSALVLTPLAISSLRKLTRENQLRFILWFCLAHVTGALLSLPQVLAMKELVSTASPSFRHNLAHAKFDSVSFLFPMLTRVRGGPAEPFLHYFNLIPATLAAFGLLSLVRRRKPRAFDVSALLCLLFFFSKNFGFFPRLDSVLASLPVLGQTYFTVFGFGILLWGFAYLAATGLNFTLEPTNTTTKWIRIAVVITVPSVLILSHRLIEHTHSLGFDKGRTIVLHLLWFLFLTLLAFSRRPSVLQHLMLGFLLILEFLVTRAPINEPTPFFAQTRNLARGVRLALESKGLDPVAIRDHSGTGDLIPAGIASADGGYAAIPERLSLFREQVFDLDSGSLYPITGVKRKDGWRLAAISLHVVGKNAFVHPVDVDTTGMELLLNTSQTQVFYDKKALGRAYIPSQCIAVSNRNEALELIGVPDRLPLGNVVVETERSPDSMIPCLKHRTRVQNIALRFDKGSSVSLAPVSGPTVIVLNDNFYPGWKARDSVSGQYLPILPANIAFRSVVLPERRSYQIDFVYVPTWRWWGMVSFSLGTTTVLFFAVAGLMNIFSHQAPCLKQQ